MEVRFRSGAAVRSRRWATPVRERQALFVELMLSWELRSFHLAEALPVPVHLERAAATFRYDRVFIAPPWSEIYEQDAERRQTYEVAVRTYEAMVATYTECGYELVELPKDSPSSRATFVLDRARS